MADKGKRPGAGGFPTTHPSALLGLHSADPQVRARSLDRLAHLYWRPVYKHLRLKWHKSPDEAQELTQDFFLRAIDAGTFRAYEPERALFRTFVRVVLDRFVIDRARQAQTRKRSPGTLAAHLDVETLEGELEHDEASDPDAAFEREWMRSLVAISLESLRASCLQKGKEEHFRVFEQWYQGRDRASYADIAATLGLSVFDVMNRLKYARREFRAVVLEVLREHTSSPQELRAEARAVLGIEI